MLEKREFEKNNFMWRTSATIAVVAGAFSLIIFILMMANYLQIRDVDPVFNEMITKMRVEYAALPDQDDALAERIQQLDLLTRKAFFTSQEFLRFGSILMLVGVSVFLISFKSMIRWRPERPVLADVPTADKEFLALAESRNLITWAGVALLAVGLLSAYMTESILMSDPETLLAAMEAEPRNIPIAESARSLVGGKAIGGIEESPAESPSEGNSALAAAIVKPDWNAVQSQWAAFRGPGSLGVAHNTTAPLSWDTATGSGIKWKVAIPRIGANSPVVWGDRLFVTGGDEERFEVFCYDTETGELKWTQPVGPFSNTPNELPSVFDETGFAAPTMAVHGEQVFAIFANADIASFDFDGNLLWGRNPGLPENHYGHSSSLIAYENFLYVQLDYMEGARLLALDVATGEPAWEDKREMISWASPILADTPAGIQLIVNSEQNVDAYNPVTGEVLWTQACLDGEVAPSPAYSNGVVFVANEFAIATAIQLDGSVGAAQSAIKWEYDEYLPEVASPVGDGERFYFGTAAGDLVCLDAATGEEVWVEEAETGFYSSPILVGDLIYILDLDGNMYIVRAAAEYELVAQIAMGEDTFATPAFIHNRIYLRTAEYLYCIE